MNYLRLGKGERLVGRVKLLTSPIKATSTPVGVALQDGNSADQRHFWNTQDTICDAGCGVKATSHIPARAPLYRSKHPNVYQLRIPPYIQSALSYGWRAFRVLKQRVAGRFYVQWPSEFWQTDKKSAPTQAGAWDAGKYTGQGTCDIHRGIVLRPFDRVSIHKNIQRHVPSSVFQTEICSR